MLIEQKVIDETIFLLNDLFPEYPSYDVKVEMGLEPPCFIVEAYNTRLTERITHGGFFYVTDCQVVFYPGPTDPEFMIRQVEFPILASLRRFGHVEPKLRGDNIYAQKREGLLYIFFSVTSEVKKLEKQPPEIKRIITKVGMKDE